MIEGFPPGQLMVISGFKPINQWPGIDDPDRITRIFESWKRNPTQGGQHGEELHDHG